MTTQQYGAITDFELNFVRCPKILKILKTVKTRQTSTNDRP